jgi:hypothetical protein
MSGAFRAQFEWYRELIYSARLKEYLWDGLFFAGIFPQTGPCDHERLHRAIIEIPTKYF